MNSQRSKKKPSKINKSKRPKDGIVMEPEELVPFTEYIRRLGNPSPGFYDRRTNEIAKIWLSDLHGRWDSLCPDVKSLFVSDLLDALYRRSGGFDALLEILFIEPENMGIWKHVDYSSTAADILRSFGMEHSFHYEGQFQNVLDFPLKTIFGIYDIDGLYGTQTFHDIDGFDGTPCDRRCLCRSIGRPLYYSFFYGCPFILRLLLNSGASLMPEEVCRLDDLTLHPLTYVHPDFFLTGCGDQTPLDLAALNLVLVDATQRLRCDLRRKFPDAVEEIPSLKHVARACVRQRLRDSRTIGRPDALRLCGLPKSVVSYIYMEDAVVDA